jgi:hypothetical protein
MEYDLEDGPWDPISGGVSALLGTLASLVIGVAVMPNGILRALKVKSAKASDGHKLATPDNNNTTPQRAPKRSTSLTLPETPLHLSQDHLQMKFRRTQQSAEMTALIQEATGRDNDVSEKHGSSGIERHPRNQTRK